MTLPNPHIADASDVLYELANFYTKRGSEGYKLDGTDYEGHTKALQALAKGLIFKMPGEPKDWGSWHPSWQSGWLTHEAKVKQAILDYFGVSDE